MVLDDIESISSGASSPRDFAHGSDDHLTARLLLEEEGVVPDQPSRPTRLKHWLWPLRRVIAGPIKEI